MNAFVTSGSWTNANTLQTSCQLFLLFHLRIVAVFPSIKDEKPAC